MDKKISEREIKKRTQKKILTVSLWAVGLVATLIVLTSILRSGVSRDSIKLSTSMTEDLNVSVSAIGKVVPIYEEVITSPVSSKILTVYKKAGDKLKKNDPILALDLMEFNTSLEQKRDELEMKRRKLEQQRITGESQIAELEMQIKIDEMKLQRVAVLLRNETYLDSIGGGTVDKIRQVRLDHEVQTLQLEQLKLKCRNQKKIIDTEIRTLELDYQIAMKNNALLLKKMGEARVMSPREGILTWVNDQIGANIDEGAQLAIVADLSHYKIEGDISDSYSDKVQSGNKVQIKVSNTLLYGTVGNIVPAVNNGLIKFSVILDKNNAEQLRTGLKVDLYVVNSLCKQVLTIDNGPYYMGPGEYDLWVVQSNSLVKRRIILGQSSYNKVEVVSGISEGEQVVVSDMNRYSTSNKLKLKK